MTFSTDFFKTELYGFRGTIWKNLTFPKFFSSKLFEIFKEKFGHLAKRFETCGGKISVNFDETALQMSGRKIVGVPSCFAIMNEHAAKRGRIWQTMGKKTHLLRGWFSLLYSKWRKRGRPLPSNSNFWKDASQKKECNMFLEKLLLRQFLIFFQKL